MDCKGARGIKGVSRNVLYLIRVQLMWVYMSRFTALNIQIYTFYSIKVIPHIYLFIYLANI